MPEIDENKPVLSENTFQIRDLFKISKGKKCDEETYSKLRYIQIEDLRHNDNFKYAATDKKNILCTNEDIIIAWDGANAGTIGYGLEGAIGSTLAKLTPLTSNVFSPYAGRFLQSKFKFLRDNCTGATIPHISTPSLLGIQIPLPPLLEQQKIASILDAADSLRQKDQQLIEKYNALSQSLFLEMFGDPVINPHNFPSYKLSDAYINAKEGTKCGPFGSALKKFEYTEKGVPVWVMDNIQKSNFVFEKCLFITEEKYLSLNNYSTLKGDIIISRAGTVGKMCVVPDGYKQAIISTNLIRLRLDNKILLPLFFVLLMKYFATNIGRIKTGPDGSFTHMNTGVLNDLTFPFPPISLQIQFYEHIQLIEAQKQQAQASLQKSEALFNSLLQRAFKGELTT